jgi:hypothetical protein
MVESATPERITVYYEQSGCHTDSLTKLSESLDTAISNKVVESARSCVLQKRYPDDGWPDYIECIRRVGCGG